MESDSNLGATNKKSQMLKKIIILGLAILALGLASFFSYTAGKRSVKAKANLLNQLSNPNSPLFANLSGTITGKITQVNGNLINIESVKGGKGIFNISSPIIVSEVNKGKLTELGKAKESIRLNENAVMRIVVLGFNDGYQINSITYIKDTPPLLAPPDIIQQASPSAKAKINK